MGAFREVKRHLDGHEEVFDCEPLRVTDEAAAVRFVLPVAMGGFPAGTVTTGYFWTGRSHTLYDLHGPAGEPMGERFDVVDEVRIEPRGVEYLDLLLDVRVGPDGAVTVEDEDEVEEAAAAGLLGPERRALIDRTRALLLTDHERIVAGARAWLRGG